MIAKPHFFGLVLSLALFVAGCNAFGQNKTTDLQSSLDRVYEIDPQRKFIGEKVEDIHFTDAIKSTQVHFDELNKDKIVIIESFSTGCPACVAGIKNYNKLYDKYSDSIEIIYLDIEPNDSPEKIKSTKEYYNGRDWEWVAYQNSLLPFYDKYNFATNEMTLIVDKGGKIAYADSFAVPIERIENELKKLGAGQ